jgi:NAD(P)H-binding
MLPPPLQLPHLAVLPGEQVVDGGVLPGEPDDRAHRGWLAHRVVSGHPDLARVRGEQGAAVGGSAREFLTAVKNGGARRAVMLSSFAVRDGDQTYSIGTQHKNLEEPVKASGLDWTFLRCGGFATNTLGWAPMIRAEGVVRAPCGKAATALLAERDIAAAATRVLAEEGHAGTTYVLTGQESVTQIEQADAIGAAIGRPLRFEELPAEVFRQAAVRHLPAAAVDDLLRYYAGFVGRTAEMAPDLVTLTGRPATTFAEWAVQHAADFR